jgi:hypothetical protein
MSPEAMKGTMEGASSSLLAAPVDGHITSGFGWRRHPILGYVRMHAGIDFGAAWGAPIHAGAMARSPLPAGTAGTANMSASITAAASAPAMAT